VTSDGLLPEARDVLQRHARSFHLASRFLPGDRRDEAAVLYAFCRLVDDTADEAPDPAVADADLNQLRAELLDRRPRRPLVAAVVATLAATPGRIGVSGTLRWAAIADCRTCW